MTLKPPSVKFRLARLADAAAVIAIYAPYCELSHVSFEVVAPSIDEMRARIERISQRFPWLVCDVDGELAGYVYASQHRERAAYRWAVDVAVYVADGRRRRGIGQALYTSLFSILREQHYFKAFAGITLPNPGSVGLHETMGFERIGVYPGVGYKLRRWLDVGWWQLSLQPEITEPPEPTPFSSIRGTDAVKRALAEGEQLVQPAAKYIR
jgi:L-amino acid N-acyltransferase YncA